jgi:hypothetical protein
VFVAAAGTLELGKLGGFALIKEFYPRDAAHHVTAADVARRAKPACPKRSTTTPPRLSYQMVPIVTANMRRHARIAMTFRPRIKRVTLEVVRAGCS